MKIKKNIFKFHLQYNNYYLLFLNYLADGQIIQKAFKLNPINGVKFKINKAINENKKNIFQVSPPIF